MLCEVLCLSMSSCSKEIRWSGPNGSVLHAGDVMAEITVQPVRRCMALVVTQNLRHYSMEGRRNFSTDGGKSICGLFDAV